MCTVSWLREADDGYTLFVSRDEKRTRKQATAPEIHERDGIRFLAPLDGERGGAWVACNEHGVAVCLLNRYDRSVRDQSEAGPSRGELVMRLASSPDREEAARRLLKMQLSRFQPFRVVCLEPGQAALTIDWTGSSLAGNFQAEDRQPLVSSSAVQEEAQRARGEVFERVLARGLTREALVDFHRSHEPERGALSPCMHREDAATASFTVVDVSDFEVRMTYRHGAPCEHGALAWLCLPRKERRGVCAA